MSTSFDITGRINAVVSSGSLNMLKKLQTELRKTAKALLKMGETSTANAMGHTAMALDKVAAGMGKVTENGKKAVEATTKTAKAIVKTTAAAEKSQKVYKQVAEGYKLNAVEAGALYKAVTRLGQKYGYAANMQKEWVPTLKSSLAEIYKQKAALVASGKAITTHVSSQELFDRTNRKLASGLHTVSGKFTDYDQAMSKSLGRSPAFRKEVDKIAGAVGKQGAAFKSQFAALTKADDLWRKHVTTLHRSGEVTTKVAKQMYAASDHFSMPLEKLRANIKSTIPQVGLFSRAMSSLVSHLRSFASYAAAATIISGIAGIFGLATRAVVKYDQALHDLQAITRATDDEVTMMGEKIREVGRTTKFSASEVAVAMRTLGQAGFTASEAISSIGAVANLATGTLTSMKTVVDLITTAIRAFDLQATETGRVADVFANAVNRSKLTIDKLRIAFNYIGPIAAKAGIAFEETNATMMMLANAGIRASTIGTGLRRTFQQLIDPTDDLKAAIEAAGYTVEDFNPQMNDMRDIIRRLTEIVPDAESAFKMFSLRSAAAVAALSSQGVSSFDALHSSLLRSGAAADMAKKQMEGLGIIFKQAWDKAHDLALAFGEAGVSGALRVLGKTLQKTFDWLRIFVGSGVLKAVVSMGALAVALYALRKAWEAIKVAQWAGTLKFFVGQLGHTAGAVKFLEVTFASFQAKFGPLLVLMAALYAAYKLHNLLLTTKVNKANTDYIEDLDEIHKKELERLEDIKRLVSVARDELETDGKRSRALIELAEKNVELNLTIEKGTGLVEKYTDKILDEKDALDKAASAFGKYKEKAKFEDLVMQARLFKETGDAIKDVVPKLDNLKKHSEGLFGKMLGAIELVIDKIPLIGGSFESSVEKMDIYRKGIDALESQQGEAYEKMVGVVASFGEITQEVWKRYMLDAGASEEEVARLFTDSEEKITQAHLAAYMKIQLARKDMTEAGKKELEKYIVLVEDLFGKVNSTTNRRLAEDLKAVREHYAGRTRLITQAYDFNVLLLKEKLGTEEESYDKLLTLARQHSAMRLAILDQQYKDEKAIIKSHDLGMVKEQEGLFELSKKTANRRLKIEQETIVALSDIHSLQIESVKKQHEAEIGIAEKAFERQKAIVEDYYSWKATKAEQDIIVDDQAFSNRLAAEGKYYEQKAALADQEIEDQKDLQAILLDIEQEKYLELLATDETYFRDQLAVEESFVSDSRRLIEEKLAANAELYKDDAGKRKEIEKTLNDELLGIIRESRGRQEAIISQSYESRIGALSAWRDKLRESYSSAKDIAQSYADKVQEIEEKIVDIRREGAEKIAGIIKTTEDRITQIRRAGMSEALIVQDKIIEARRKTAIADKLAADESIESQKKAAKMYGEIQGIWTDVSTAVQKAAKEGKSIGVNYEESMGKIVQAGSKAIVATEKVVELQEKQKRADQAAAKATQAYWEAVAEGLKKSFNAVAIAMSDLDETLREVNGLAARTKEAIEDIGLAADEVDLDLALDISGVEEATEGVEALSEAYKNLPPVLESTKASMDGINEAAARANVVTEDAADALSAKAEAYADVSESVDEAKRKTEELSKAGEEGAEVTYAQAHAAFRHAEDLEMKTGYLEKDLKAEKKSLTGAEKKLKSDKKLLVTAKANLAEMLKSGTASKEEIATAKERVVELEKTVKSSEASVESQKKVVTGAQNAATAMRDEAAAARELADALDEAVVSSGGMMANFFKAGPTSSIAVKDWASSIINLLGEVSEKAQEAATNVTRLFMNATSAFRKAQEEGIDLANIEEMIVLYEELAVAVEKQSRGLKAAWGVGAAMFHRQAEEAEAVLKVFKEFIDEAIRVQELVDQLDALAEALDETSGEYEEATLAAANFKGEVAGSVAELQALIEESQEAIDSIKYLSEEDLASLEGSIEAAKDRLVELTEQAVKAKEELISIGEKLQDQLDRQLGKLTEIEERRYAAQIEDIKRLYEESGKSAEALAAYLEALALAEELHREKMADAVEKQNKAEMDDEAAKHKQRMDDLDEYLKKLKEPKTQTGPWGPTPQLGFASGGMVPGSGFGDTVRAMLTPGEFVLTKDIVGRLGMPFLNALNSFKSFVPKFATGGFVDNILARLSPGEFVLRAEAVKQVGIPFLNALNNFKFPVPAFAGGGLVEPASNVPVGNIPSVQKGISLQINITGAGEITEKKVRKWIYPAINKIQRLQG